MYLQKELIGINSHNVHRIHHIHHHYLYTNLNYSNLSVNFYIELLLGFFLFGKKFYVINV